ncbi:MAG: PAS domain-containing protein [Caulobacteraceae bacterium]
MFHSNTEFLIDYWRGRTGGGPTPTRSAIAPAAFPHLLPQIFIARACGDGRFPVRLAGERIVELHGGGVRGADLTGFWTEPDRNELKNLLAACLRRGAPLVLTAQAGGAKQPPFDIEVLFAPFVVSGAVADRFLGLYQPLGEPAAADRPRARRLSILSIAELPATDASAGDPRGAGDLSRRAPLRLACLDGRRIA